MKTVDKTKIGRPKGANKKLVGIWLPNDLNDELHQILAERGMTLSGAVEVAIRNYLRPAAQKTLKAPRPLRARGCDRFIENMRRKIKAAGGRLALTEEDIKGEISSAGILYRPSQLEAYLLKLTAAELLDFRVEFDHYIFETVEWKQEQKSNETKNHLKDREKAYTEVEQTAAPETKATPEVQPTPEDEEVHQRYLDLAAKAEAEDDQKRRSEIEKREDEQEKRFRKQVMGLSA